jgi:hypothetical protein
MRLTKEQLLKFFESQEKRTYLKYGQFLYRNAIEGETILTVVNGKLETIKTAEKNEVVLRNISIGSSAETYVISYDKFVDRYTSTPTQKLIDGQFWSIAEAKGKIEAFEFTQYQLVIGEPTIIFDAPWNEEMICYRGDYLARPIPGCNNDIYRIERETFNLTYREEL